MSMVSMNVYGWEYSVDQCGMFDSKAEGWVQIMLRDYFDFLIRTRGILKTFFIPACCVQGCFS